MAHSKTTNTYNRQNWEDSEFPILCATCLGENPYLRMMKERFGKECKICTRPFTVFRWCPGPKARFKKTEVCQTCAKVKNVCQTCVLDLQYGVPVEVRDKALKANERLPRSDVGREYHLQQVERALADDPTVPWGAPGKAQAPSDMMMRLARTAPYYKRNRPHICSFWVKGECRRGEECPYRHEKPTDPDDPLSDQNIRDRYYGVNDPVADKLLKKYDSLPKLVPPEDRTITTLYVGGVTEDIGEKQLRDFFYQFGELRSVTVVHKQACAFVQYTGREAAERAAEKSYDKLVIDGKRLTLRWGKNQAQLGLAGGSDRLMLEPVPGIPASLPPLHMPVIAAPSTSLYLPPPLSLLGSDMEPLPPGIPSLPQPPLPPVPPPPTGLASTGIHYPSQDPSRMGTFTVKNA